MKQLVLAIGEPPTVRLLDSVLPAEGFEVQVAADDREADLLMARRLPDVVLVDRTLPGLSGLQLTKRLRSRAETARMPIIMLSARANEIDIVEGLDSGVDDYVCKPFSTRELAARMRALIGRFRGRGMRQASEEPVSRHGRVQLGHEDCTVRVGDAVTRLAPTEFRLLAYMIRSPERVHQRSMLVARVWGNGRGAVDLRTIDVHVRRLRLSLAAVELSEAVETVRGIGYKFRRDALGEPADDTP